MRLTLRTTTALLAAALSFPTLTGCEARIYPAGGYREVYVDDVPPPPRTEVAVGVAPGPDFVWIGGRWWRDRDRWAWREGRWDRRPYARARWEGGRWEHRGRGYVWVDGRWR
jgi:hypothetical protein